MNIDRVLANGDLAVHVLQDRGLFVLTPAPQHAEDGKREHEKEENHQLVQRELFRDVTAWHNAQLLLGGKHVLRNAEGEQEKADSAGYSRYELQNAQFEEIAEHLHHPSVDRHSREPVDQL